MRILVTNDDGIDAEGLAVLVQFLSDESYGGKGREIVVLAPEAERSGVSHAMTLRRPTKVRKLNEGYYSCSGTPADCVIVAGLGVLPWMPDLVVSGINRGPNMGTDIVYSGTCGAARQAALAGVPAIAVSCAAPGLPLLRLLRRGQSRSADEALAGGELHQHQLPIGGRNPTSRPLDRSGD